MRILNKKIYEIVGQKAPDAEVSMDQLITDSYVSESKEIKTDEATKSHAVSLLQAEVEEHAKSEEKATEVVSVKASGSRPVRVVQKKVRKKVKKRIVKKKEETSPIIMGIAIFVILASGYYYYTNFL